MKHYYVVVVVRRLGIYLSGERQPSKLLAMEEISTELAQIGRKLSFSCSAIGVVYSLDHGNKGIEPHVYMI